MRLLFELLVASILLIGLFSGGGVDAELTFDKLDELHQEEQPGWKKEPEPIAGELEAASEQSLSDSKDPLAPSSSPTNPLDGAVKEDLGAKDGDELGGSKVDGDLGRNDNVDAGQGGVVPPINPLDEPLEHPVDVNPEIPHDVVLDGPEPPMMPSGDTEAEKMESEMHANLEEVGHLPSDFKGMKPEHKEAAMAKIMKSHLEKVPGANTTGSIHDLHKEFNKHKATIMDNHGKAKAEKAAKPDPHHTGDESEPAYTKAKHHLDSRGVPNAMNLKNHEVDAIVRAIVTRNVAKPDHLRKKNLAHIKHVTDLAHMTPGGFLKAFGEIHEPTMKHNKLHLAELILRLLGKEDHEVNQVKLIVPLIDKYVEENLPKAGKEKKIEELKAKEPIELVDEMETIFLDHNKAHKDVIELKGKQGIAGLDLRTIEKLVHAADLLPHTTQTHSTPPKPFTPKKKYTGTSTTITDIENGVRTVTGDHKTPLRQLLVTFSKKNKEPKAEIASKKAKVVAAAGAAKNKTTKGH